MGNSFLSFCERGIVMLDDSICRSRATRCGIPAGVMSFVTFMRDYFIVPPAQLPARVSTLCYSHSGSCETRAPDT